MQKDIKYTLLLLPIMLLCFSFLKAQKVVNVDSVYNKRIKTIETKINNRYESVILVNNSNEKLTISFDDLNSEAQNYGYSLKLCNADWSDSPLSEFDYLDGFIDNDIDQYTYSLKTLTQYVHYQISLPNNSVNFKIAGNYLLTVFNLDDKQPLFTKRIVVSNTDLAITATLKTAKRNSEQIQSISMFLQYPEAAIDVLTESFTATIVKNNNWSNAIYNVPLNIAGENSLFVSEAIHFKSGNEFRQFDIKSLEERGENVQSTLFSLNNYLARLEIDTPRNYTHYIFEDDKNGWFEIKNNQKKGADVTSEYVDVVFTLQTNQKLDFGQVFIAGMFNQWKATDLMSYNADIQSYTATISLKQGTYNYSYGLKTKTGFDPYYFEGNMMETDNEYFIIIYKSDITKNYDEAIGIATINPQ